MTTEYNGIKSSGKAVTKPEEQQHEAAKIKKVVTGEVKQVKKGLLERIVHSLVGPEGIRAVGRYVGHEVVAPAVKGIIADSVTTGINSMMYGPDGRRGSNQRNNYNRSTGYGNRGGYQKTNYSNRGGGYGPQDDPDEAVVVRKQRFDSAEYILSSRNEAMSVIENLDDYLQDYEQITVADFKDTIGITTEFTDNNFGWRSVDDFKVQAFGRGFIINSPRAMKL